MLEDMDEGADIIEEKESLESHEAVQNKIGNEHLYNLLVNQEVSWQAIIYDLMNTGQLDPWDINLAVLANKYLAKIKELEEANFLISSKVMLAASILLRIKSEILLNEYIQSLDDILFGKKPVQKKYERIEIDMNEVPVLYPKTPMPRLRKVSLQELMNALNKAMSTETRRIKKEIIEKQAMKQAEIVLPRSRINIKDRIRKLYSQILTAFKRKQSRIPYSELVGPSKEERIACFLPVLHLDNQQKVWLEQEKHFDEIYVWLYHHYKSQNPTNQVLKDIEEVKEELSASEENPLGGFFSTAEKLGME